MARRGDGIYLRGNTWWLEFVHDGKRHYARLGKGINRTVAGELAQVKRAAILKGEAGIGGPRRRDLTFDQAKAEFLRWAEANKRPRTVRGRLLASAPCGPTRNAWRPWSDRSRAGASATSARSTWSATSGCASRPACGSWSTGSWPASGPW